MQKVDQLELWKNQRGPLFQRVASSMHERGLKPSWCHQAENNDASQGEHGRPKKRERLPWLWPLSL